MKLLIVILNYRVTDLTIDCLRSLAGKVEKVPGAHVVVCENGTGGDAPERLRRTIDEQGWGAWVDLKVVYPNLGFTGGNNVVIREAMATVDRPEYVLLLNADTIVLDGALEALVDFMDREPKAGIAGSQLLSPSGENQGSPWRFFGVLSEFDRGFRLGIVSKALAPWTQPPSPREPCSVEWVCGASMILRQSMLDQIGLLDEGLYTYFDDIDICLRARRAGWETWYVPESRVIHLEGASTGVHWARPKRRPDYWFQARRRFFLKNYGSAYTALVDAAFLSGFAMWRVRRRIQGKPDMDPPQMLWDSIRHSVFRTGFEVTEVENPALRQRSPGG